VIALRVPDDPRLAGLSVGGSMADGSADAFSDIDLHVEVDPAHLDAFVADRLDAFRRMAGPVLAVSAFPPEPGADHLTLALQATADGVHEIDWHVWPAGGITMTGIRPLRPDEQQPGGGDEDAADAVDAVRLVAGRGGAAWLATWIAAKYVARGWPRAVIQMLGSALNHLDAAATDVSQVQPLDRALLAARDLAGLTGAVFDTLIELTRPSDLLLEGTARYRELTLGRQS
jgi:hypothetical protein